MSSECNKCLNTEQYAAIPFLSVSDGKIFAAELDLKPKKNVPAIYWVGLNTHLFQQLQTPISLLLFRILKAAGVYVPLLVELGGKKQPFKNAQTAPLK